MDDKIQLELLRLLTATHEDTRWWTIKDEDLACGQCVEEMRERTNGRLRQAVKLLDNVKHHGHYDAGPCRHECIHGYSPENRAAQFFHALGRSATAKLHNIVLDLTSSLGSKTGSYTNASTDVLLAAVAAAIRYLPGLTNVVVRFHLGPHPELKHCEIKRIMCALKKLEKHLPGRRRVKVEGWGLEKNRGELQFGKGWLNENSDEGLRGVQGKLICAWTKKSRRWWE
jgi:hypothetical protein